MPKHFHCINCEQESQVGSSKTNKYCSNSCQQEYQTKERHLLVEKGQAPKGSWVKRYLVDKYGDQCMNPNCAWDYSKIHVPTELEHKDGNSENNTLENCILLCPNCHSLTKTWKSKNKGNGRWTRRQRYANGLSY